MSKPIVVDADARALVAASERMHKIMSYAQKAEAFDTIATMFKEIELLEKDVESLRRSRSKNAPLNQVALIAKIAELKLLIAGIIARHAGK